MLNRQTLLEMTDLVKRREVSPEELVEAHLAQMERVDPTLHAFVMQFPSEARAEARRLRWESPSGALHGIPLTVKDSLDVRSYPTLCGSKLRLRHRAERDATSVQRLRDAGGVILGKTNCPEFLLNYETDNAITGWTANPWDEKRSAGGSSGGEAAAIASCCSAGGLGTDGGGSIRVPAHFCGIAGLKPTPGRVSGAGHFPEISYPSGLLGVVGPMARTAADVRLLFQVLAAYDYADPFSAPVPIRKPDTAELRIGVATSFCNIPVENAIRDAVLRAAKAAEGDLRWSVEEFSFAGLENAPAQWWFFFTELFAPFVRELLDSLGNDAHWTGRELVDSVPQGQSITGRDVVEHLAVRDKMRVRLLRKMQDTPVLIMPVCSVAAFKPHQRIWEIDGHETGLRDAVACSTFCNLFGLPSVVIPFGKTDDGLPVGIQIVGGPFSEELLLEVAVRLEEVRGPFPLPEV